MCLPSGCASLIVICTFVLILWPFHENSLPESPNIAKKGLARLKLSEHVFVLPPAWVNRKASCEILAQSWPQQSVCLQFFTLSWSSLILVQKRFIIQWASLYQSRDCMLQAVKNAAKMLQITLKTFWQNFGRSLQRSIYTPALTRIIKTTWL